MSTYDQWSANQEWRQDTTPITGCSGCSTTGGRMACPHHGPQARPVGVNDVMVLNAWQQGTQLCALGYHAWVPWWSNPNGCSWVTWCAREGCDHAEQFDI